MTSSNGREIPHECHTSATTQCGWNMTGITVCHSLEKYIFSGRTFKSMITTLTSIDALSLTDSLASSHLYFSHCFPAFSSNQSVTGTHRYYCLADAAEITTAFLR